MEKVSIAIIENNYKWLNNISDYLIKKNGLKVIIKSLCESDFITNFSLLEKLPNFIIIGVFKPFSINIKLIQSIHKISPNSKIISLMNHFNEELINQSINSGATAYLIKNETIEQTIREVYSIDNYGNHISTDVFNNVSKHYTKLKYNYTYETGKFNCLSDREIQILNQICKSKTSQEISEILSLSKRTVDTHRNNIIKKTNSKNVIDLVVKALKLGIIHL